MVAMVAMVAVAAVMVVVLLKTVQQQMKRMEIILNLLAVVVVVLVEHTFQTSSRTMTISRPDIGKSMLSTSAIFACTTKGCSSPTKGTTRLPSAPEVASIRVTSKDQLIFDILAPRNDGGANVVERFRAIWIIL